MLCRGEPRSSGAARAPARAVGCGEPPAQGPLPARAGSMAQGLRSRCAALACQACSAILGISSAPLIGISGAAATGTCRPRSSFSWRRRPAVEPAATPCRMTPRSAFSHPLPPPPLHSPELRPGLSQRPWAPVPLGQPRGPPPRGTSRGDPVSPRHLLVLACHSQPGPGHRLPAAIRRGTSAAQIPRARAVPGTSCPAGSRPRTQHMACGTRHAAARGLLPLKAFLLLPSPRESPPPAEKAPRSSLVPLAPQFVASQPLAPRPRQPISSRVAIRPRSLATGAFYLI